MFMDVFAPSTVRYRQPQFSSVDVSNLPAFFPHTHTRRYLFPRLISLSQNFNKDRFIYSAPYFDRVSYHIGVCQCDK
jgi:hypothetical protein